MPSPNTSTTSPQRSPPKKRKKQKYNKKKYVQNQTSQQQHSQQAENTDVLVEYFLQEVGNNSSLRVKSLLSGGAGGKNYAGKGKRKHHHK
eukprot:122931-Ditylum_brightwellii.AAC.1